MDSFGSYTSLINLNDLLVKMEGIYLTKIKDLSVGMSWQRYIIAS